MKKIFYLFLLPILLVGCSKETEKLSEPSPVGGMISVHSQREFSDGPLSASAIHSDVFTRVAGDAVLAYTFEAWTRDANPRCVLHKTVTGTLTEAVFEIALIPGNYDFLFWADFGKGYYNTSDLRQISFDGIPYMSGSDRDAFACALENVRWNGGNGVGATLKRPLAKLMMQNKAAFTTGGQTVSVTYTNVPTQYDVLTGTASDPQTVTLAFPNTTVGSVTVGEDFIFVPSEGTPVGLVITVGDVKKELDALPLKPNYQTNVTATFE